MNYGIYGVGVLDIWTPSLGIAHWVVGRKTLFPDRWNGSYES
jgi:hypothetical protein